MGRRENLVGGASIGDGRNGEIVERNEFTYGVYFFML